jgi:putative nucleotidyltransferase with HDIG domain
VLQRQDGLFDIIDIKTPDNYIYNHSINVCILSILMGRQLKLERDQLKELAIGAFLHDLGKVYLKSSLKKLEELSTQDIAQIKQHTKKGFDILRTTPGFTIKIANIAYQHHEREDGSGYPLGLIGEDIPLYSKIVALADSYDAMVSKRIYRESLWNDQVLIELEKETPRKYDPEVVSALRQSVAVYPIGSIVQLSDGQSAVVVEVSSSKTVLQYLEVSAGFSEVRADLETKIEKRLA